MRCVICCCDINAEGMDNVSPFSGYPVCERCADDMTESEWIELETRYNLDREDEEDSEDE